MTARGSSINPINMTEQNTTRFWVIYGHKVDGVLIYIGMCKLSDLLGFPDVRGNAEWYKLTAKGFTIEAVEEINDYAECKVRWGNYVAQYRPRANLYSRVVRRKTRVRCIETGAEYETAADAAQMNGIAAPTMSNHLNGRVGYAKIHGMTFERI